MFSSSIYIYFTCLWLDHPFVYLVGLLNVGKCLKTLELDRETRGYFFVFFVCLFNCVVVDKC